MFNRSLLVLGVLLAACSSPSPKSVRQAPVDGYRGWPSYGGGEDQIRYSALTQITPENVQQLKQAWVYDTGDAFEGTEMQCNPIVVDGLLYASSPKLRVFALNAATGEEQWSYSPREDSGELMVGRFRNRGVMHWASSDGSDSRIYFAAKHRLHALDAKTGELIESFGAGGVVDLRENLGREPEDLNVSMTTPGSVYDDLLILGSIVSEGLPSAPGDIRAYDARTGEFRWGFRTIPRPGETGYETWSEDSWKVAGGANSWPGLALDEKRGLVYAGTGSAAFDFYGANRVGDNLYANSLLCLRAETGELVWHYQFVKHDVWDRDFPTPPSLVTVERDGELIDVVAQATKSSHILMFERETGDPIYPIEEFDTPPSDVPGEVLSKTQALPTAPPPLSRQELTADDLSTRTPEVARAVRERFKKIRSGPQFTPPSREGTIVFPGFDGGPEWGGQAFDPETGLYYANCNEMAWILRLVEQKELRGDVTGKRLYQRNCAACHQDDLSGTPPEFPALTDLSSKSSRADVEKIIREGAGRMPAFAHLDDGPVEAITTFLMSGKEMQLDSADIDSSPYNLAFTHDGYNKFLDPDGYPAIAPPWGTLNAVDLDRGEIRWSIPFGEFPELVEQGMADTGSENYGGPIVTKSGLLFIGATNHDRKFRAFDKLTGELLWETLLPDASGNATPAMYEIGGKQFVVIGAGGGKSGAPSGGKYVAFALP